MSDTYADTGCTVSPSCLHCQMPACIYDSPNPGNAVSIYLRRQRDAEIILRYREALGGASQNKAKMVAKSLNITPRTVHRARRRERGEVKEHD